MAKFVVGDKVKLNSGGPVMTVEGVDGFNPRAFITAWFDSRNQVQHSSFEEAMLIKVDTVLPHGSKSE